MPCSQKSSPAQFSALSHHRDIIPSSPPSSHDRFLASSNGYSRRKRPSTSSTDSLEISMGFKRLLAKPADPPLRHRSSSAAVTQPRNNKSFSDSEGLVNANRRTPRPTMGMASDTDTPPPRPTIPVPDIANQDHHRIQHQLSTSHLSPSTSQRNLTRHSSKSPLRSHIPSLEHHLHAYLSDSSDIVATKMDAPHAPSKPRNVLRRKNSARDHSLSTPTFEIVTPQVYLQPKRKPVPSADVDKLTPAGAVAQAYMAQEKRREELAQSARATIPPLSKKGQSTPPPQSLIEPKSGQLVAVGHPEDSSARPSPKTPNPHPRSNCSLPLPVPAHNNSLPSLNSSSTSCCMPSQLPSTPKDKALNRKRSFGLFPSGDRKDKEKDKDSPRPSPHTFSSFSKNSSNHGNPNEFGQSLHGNQTSPTISMDSPNSGGSAGGSGNKLWKLMKRISTSGLREKFAAQEAPPVPALPLHLTTSQRSDAAEHSVDENGHDRHLYKKKSSSKSKTRPVTTTVNTSITRPSIEQVDSPSPIDDYNPRPSMVEALSPDYRLPQQGGKMPSVPFPHTPDRPLGSSPQLTASSSPAITRKRSITNPLEKFKANPSQTTLTSMDSGVFSADDGDQPVYIVKSGGKPGVLLGRHILSPSELTAQMDPDASLPFFGSYSAPSSPPHSVDRHEDKGLPIPPRGRQLGSPEKSPRRLADDSYLDFDNCDSPVLPSFTIENAVNTFGPRSRPSASRRSSRSNLTSSGDRPYEFQIVEVVRTKSLKRRPSLKDIVLPRGDDLVARKEKLRRPATADLPSPTTSRPPTRPSRHPSRPPPPTRPEDDKRRYAHTAGSSRVSDEFHAIAQIVDSRQIERPRSNSFSGNTTAGKGSPHRSTSHRATPSRATFRELEAKLPKQLSEAEKARRWDELMARSEQAGGTLHLGGIDRLESDHL